MLYDNQPISKIDTQLMLAQICPQTAIIEADQTSIDHYLQRRSYDLVIFGLNYDREAADGFYLSAISRVLIFYCVELESVAVDCLAYGAAGCLSKQCSYQELELFIKQLLSRHRVICPADQDNINNAFLNNRRQELSPIQSF